MAVRRPVANSFLFCVLFSLGMTNTIAFVVLVDMLGVNKLPKSMAMFNLIVAFGSMTAAPVSGKLQLVL